MALVDLRRLVSRIRSQHNHTLDSPDGRLACFTKLREKLNFTDTPPRKRRKSAAADAPGPSVVTRHSLAQARSITPPLPSPPVVTASASAQEEIDLESWLAAIGDPLRQTIPALTAIGVTTVSELKGLTSEEFLTLFESDLKAHLNPLQAIYMRRVATHLSA